MPPIGATPTGQINPPIWGHPTNPTGPGTWGQPTTPNTGNTTKPAGPVIGAVPSGGTAKPTGPGPIWGQPTNPTGPGTWGQPTTPGTGSATKPTGPGATTKPTGPGPILGQPTNPTGPGTWGQPTNPTGPGTWGQPTSPSTGNTTKLPASNTGPRWPNPGVVTQPAVPALGFNLSGKWWGSNDYTITHSGNSVVITDGTTTYRGVISGYHIAGTWDCPQYNQKGSFDRFTYDPNYQQGYMERISGTYYIESKWGRDPRDFYADRKIPARPANPPTQSPVQPPTVRPPANTPLSSARTLAGPWYGAIQWYGVGLVANAVQSGSQLTITANNGHGTNITITGTISGNIYSANYQGTLQAWEGAKSGPVMMEIGSNLNEMGGYLQLGNTKLPFLLKRGVRGR